MNRPGRTSAAANDTSAAVEQMHKNKMRLQFEQRRLAHAKESGNLAAQADARKRIDSLQKAIRSTMGDLQRRREAASPLFRGRNRATAQNFRTV